MERRLAKIGLGPNYHVHSVVSTARAFHAHAQPHSVCTAYPPLRRRAGHRMASTTALPCCRPTANMCSRRLT
jgi:hypothetical protein